MPHAWFRKTFICICGGKFLTENLSGQKCPHDEIMGEEQCRLQCGNCVDQIFTPRQSSECEEVTVPVFNGFGGN